MDLVAFGGQTHLSPCTWQYGEISTCYLSVRIPLSIPHSVASRVMGKFDDVSHSSEKDRPV